MRTPAAVFALVFLALFVACQAAPPPVTFTEDDAAAVRSVIQETYAQAMLEGDLETVMSIWAADAFRVPPTGESLQGSDAIRASYEGMDYRVTELAWTNVVVEGSGDLAFWPANYAFGAETDEAAIAETGTSFVVFRRAGDSWLAVANMWRPDPQPAEGSDVAPVE